MLHNPKITEKNDIHFYAIYLNKKVHKVSNYRCWLNYCDIQFVIELRTTEFQFRKYFYLPLAAFAASFSAFVTSFLRVSNNFFSKLLLLSFTFLTKSEFHLTIFLTLVWFFPIKFVHLPPFSSNCLLISSCHAAWTACIPSDMELADEKSTSQ